MQQAYEFTSSNWGFRTWNGKPSRKAELAVVQSIKKWSRITVYRN
jgi:hypothetical protein